MNLKAKFVPITEIKVGDIVSGNLVVKGVRRTAKRVYLTVENSILGTTDEMYQDHRTQITVWKEGN